MVIREPGDLPQALEKPRTEGSGACMMRISFKYVLEFDQ